MLLDKADVFLKAYAPKDIVCNSIVLVFLYIIEYCQGIMLLITNYVTKFDLAALSRIYLKVKYDNLTSKARREV